MSRAETNGGFALDLPASMHQTSELHDFAPLQYADDKNGYFIIGLEESKNDLADINLYYSIEDYSWFVERTVSRGLDTAVVRNTEMQLNNGFEISGFDLFGELNSGEDPLEIYYRLVVIESKKGFYQFIAWTARQNHSELKEMMDKAICSFEEVNRETDPIVKLVDGQGKGAETAHSNP